MSKKDYIIVAGDFKKELARATTPEAKEAIKNLALCLTLSFRVDNIRFDDARFLTACGIN